VVTTPVQCFLVGTDGSRKRTRADEEPWLDPAALERIEVLGADRPQARVVAYIDQTVLPLARRPDDPAFVLALNDALRSDLYRAGDLGLEVRIGGEVQWFLCRVVPGTLEPDEPRFAVQQRRRAEVPGSRGFLTVLLDDITGGQVLLTVEDANGRTVVAQRSVGDGDAVPLNLAGGAFVLIVDRLVNRLIGDDHAELRVARAAGNFSSYLGVFSTDNLRLNSIYFNTRKSLTEPYPSDR
jgi:hypothetical protein